MKHRRTLNIKPRHRRQRVTITRSTHPATAHEHVFGEAVLEDDVIPGIPAYVRRCILPGCHAPATASAFAS